MSTYSNFPYKRQFEQFVADNLRASAVNMMGMRTARNTRKRQRVTIHDDTSYQQWKKYKIRDGRWRNALLPTLKANLYRQDYTFKRLKSFESRGSVGMDYSIAADGHAFMPLYTLALNGVKQAHFGQDGSVISPVLSAQPFRRYQRQASGHWVSVASHGFLTDGTQSLNLEDPSTHLEDAGGMGPSGFLKWTSVKFNFWGARKKQTTFYVDIVRATDHNGCPYAYNSGSSLPDVLGQHLDEIMRPLTVNPIATANNLVRSPWKVLKRIKVELDPVVTTEGDPDGHVKTLELFNRWGRIVRFDRAIDDATLVTNNPQFTGHEKGVRDDATSVINFFPDHTSILFLVIRCNLFTLSTAGSEFNPDIHPSFDINFRSSWSKIE